jgi:hypothetical protein
MFASKPQLAGALLDRAHRLGIRAAFVAGDKVYGWRSPRARAHRVASGAGKPVPCGVRQPLA